MNAQEKKQAMVLLVLVVVGGAVFFMMDPLGLFKENAPANQPPPTTAPAPGTTPGAPGTPETPEETVEAAPVTPGFEAERGLPKEISWPDLPAGLADPFLRQVDDIPPRQVERDLVITSFVLGVVRFAHTDNQNFSPNDPVTAPSGAEYTIVSINERGHYIVVLDRNHNEHQVYEPGFKPNE